MVCASTATARTPPTRATTARRSATPGSARPARPVHSAQWWQWNSNDSRAALRARRLLVGPGDAPEDAGALARVRDQRRCNDAEVHDVHGLAGAVELHVERTLQPAATNFGRGAGLCRSVSREI